MKSQTDPTFSRKSTWMNDAAKCITITTIVLSVVGIIGYSVDLYRHGQQKHYIGWFSSAGFVLLTVPISVRLIVMHLTHWYSPNIQKYVVRIIWMVPIYSVESWLALRFKSLALYIETVRECYEAYVIFSFLYFLIALLGEEQQIVAKLKVKSAEYGKHFWPVNLIFSPWSMGSELLSKCKFGVFQYVLIKNVSAIIVCITASFGYYREDTFRLDEGYVYHCVISNISQLWALYCLVLFYFATKEELAPWRPVGKFFCVKMVVFFTWWQSIAITALASTNALDSTSEDNNWTVNEISKGLHNYLICIEMFFASIAFNFAFTHKDYVIAVPHGKDKDWDEDVEASRPFLSALMQSSVPDEIFADISRQFSRSVSVSRKISSNENAELLSSDAQSSSPPPAAKDSAVVHTTATNSKHSIELLRKDTLRHSATTTNSSTVSSSHHGVLSVPVTTEIHSSLQINSNNNSSGKNNINMGTTLSGTGSAAISHSNGAVSSAKSTTTTTQSESGTLIVVDRDMSGDDDDCLGANNEQNNDSSDVEL